MKIVVATTNQHKLQEIASYLTDCEIVSAAAVGFTDEVAETGQTFLDNAFLKARAVAEATGLLTLADDSGLCVDALHGAPGIYSARYSGGSMADNRRLLLKNLHGVTDRRAKFVCALVLVLPDGREFTTIGETHGQITTQEYGANGFGYDSLFRSDDLHKTFAEATPAEKLAVSHRGRALQKLVAIIADLTQKWKGKRLVKKCKITLDTGNLI